MPPIEFDAIEELASKAAISILPQGKVGEEIGDGEQQTEICKMRDIFWPICRSHTMPPATFFYIINKRLLCVRTLYPQTQSLP